MDKENLYFCVYCGRKLRDRFSVGYLFRTCPKNSYYSTWRWLRGDGNSHTNEIIGPQPNYFDPKTGEPLK